MRTAITRLAIAAGLLLSILIAYTGAQENPIVRVRGDRNYPPFEFLNEQGEPDGFNVEIMRAIAREMNLTVQIDLGQWDVVRCQLERGEIDALAGMFQTQERQNLVEFSTPHFTATYSVFVRKDSPIQSIIDAHGKTILVQSGDLGYDYVREKNLTDSVILREDWEQVLHSLSKGDGDCAIVSRLQGMMLISQARLNNIRPAGPPFLQHNYCIAVRKGDTELLAKINEGLSILKTTGEYNTIFDKWFGKIERNPMTLREVLRYASWIFIPLLLVITAGALWTWSLKRQVAIQTEIIRHDLLERKRIEQAIRESEENLRITLNSIGDAVVSTDTEGRIIRMNPVAETLTGWRQDEALGRPFSEVFHIADIHSREPFPDPIQQVLADQRITEVPHPLLLFTKDGSERRVIDSGAPIRNSDGTIVGVVLVFRDITERHRMEEQIRQSQKMESIGQLAGGIAHDFNNMLAGILGYSELLVSNLVDTPQLQQYAMKITEIVDRAAGLTRKLLVFSRKNPKASAPVDIHATIHEAIAILERSIDRRITIRQNLHAVHTIIEGDSSQLLNAILNLSVNARDAMPQGGDLAIETCNVEIDSNFRHTHPVDMDNGLSINIRISDTGTGISKEIQDRIFEPFFTTKSMENGTGLGLSIVYGTIKDHHGTIAFHSEEGNGTVFDIYLPVLATGTRDESHPSDSDVRGSGCILVIDDEEMIRITLHDMLEDLGYEVIQARDGMDGIEQFKQHRGKINIVLLDMVMPKMNGMDCFRQLRQLDPRIKILILSGYTRDVSLSDLLTDGSCGFIQKPVRRIELSRKLAEILG